MQNIKQKIVILSSVFFLAFFLAAHSASAAINFSPSLALTFGLTTLGLKALIIKVINYLLGFLGIVAVAVMVYGGFMWMTSQGVSQKIERAKKILLSGAIGLLIVLLSFAIVLFVKRMIMGSGGAGGSGAGSGSGAGGSGAALFLVNNSSPLNGATNVIRNKVVRIYLNASPVGGTVNASTFYIQDSGGTVAGTITQSGSLLEFKPNASCPAPYSAYKCFAANTSFTIKVTTGILRSGDNQPLTCNALHPCIFHFKTGTVIDTQKPTNLSLGITGNLCINTNNHLNLYAEDDSGIDFFHLIDNKSFSAFNYSPICTGVPPHVHCSAIFNWHPTVAAGYVAGHTYSLTETAQDLDSNSQTLSQSVILRKAHCCDGVKDDGEKGVDCGGPDCAACAGAACGNDMNTACSGTPSCTPNNDICVTHFCGCVSSTAACLAAEYAPSVSHCCICQSAPVITCVTPNVTSSCSPASQPVGTKGNFLTISGSGFGSTPGQVTINGVVAPLASTVNPECTSSWTDHQIIVVVPNGAGGGAIKVTNSGGLSDTTDNSRGPVIPNFHDNGLKRPSLCLVKNTTLGSSCLGAACGYFHDSFKIAGINFASGDKAYFGAAPSFIQALNSTPLPSLSLKAKVPNLAAGLASLSVLSASGLRSNFLNFTAKVKPKGPHIDYLDPDYGPPGTYVTVYGSGFGSTPAGSSLTFNGVLGNFSFPAICKASDYWTNNYIVVKVPASATTGDVKVKVNGKESNGVNFHICSLGSPGCVLKPGICKLSPVSGPINTPVSVFGDNFGSSTGDVEFYDGSPAFPNLPATTIFSWSNQKIIGALVPTGAQTGPVYAKDSASVYSSNSLPFNIGSCKTNADCPNPSAQVCCSGACYTGSCPTPNFSTYSWSFTTGDYFVKQECSASSLPSPTPWTNWAGGKAVCVNAAIAAGFTVPVLETSLNSGTVLVQKCIGSGSDPCLSLGAPLPGSFVYVGSGSGGGITYFYFNPTSLLAKNSWYQVTLKGGLGGVTSLAGNPLIDDYVWHFKTRDDNKQCQLSRVLIHPKQAKIVDISSKQPFSAIPLSKTKCLVLNSFFYTYHWTSSKSTVAVVSSAVTSPNINAVPHNKGETKIQVKISPDNISGTADLVVDFLGLSVIKKHYQCKKVCINAYLGAVFDRALDVSTLTANQNIRLYQCLDGAACHNLSLVPITSPSYFWDVASGHSTINFQPTGGNLKPDTYYRIAIKGEDKGIKSKLGNPLVSLNANLASGEACETSNPLCNPANCLWKASANLCGTPYQECKKGTLGCNSLCHKTGSVDNECGDGKLENDRGENCDYDGVCVNSTTKKPKTEMKYIPSLGVKEKSYVFCRAGVPGAPSCGAGYYCKKVKNNGCSDKCLLEGSTGSAVCGDGIIEFGEECDDGNATNGDGCSSRCLLEPVDPSKCGNGVLDKGEECDPKILTNGECTNNCFLAGEKWSKCGDGKVGIGEECDDGNATNNDGCSSQCLWEGSTGLAKCGDGILDQGNNDSFSWIFKTRANPGASCPPHSIEVLPVNSEVYVGSTKKYQAEIFSAPDSCSATGESLNPWAYNWNWLSSNPAVATTSLWDINSDSKVDPEQEAKGISSPAAPGNIVHIFAQAAGISGAGILKVLQPAPPGVPCKKSGSSCCNHGVDSCSIGYQCLSDNTFCSVDSTTVNNCRCCCAPPPAPNSCPAPLVCQPNVSPCTTSKRGLCCGCKSDADCGGLGSGFFCGSNGCCYPRPKIVLPSEPKNGDTNVCRNAVMSIAFNQIMDVSTFRNNIEVAGNYTAEGSCPTGMLPPALLNFPSGEVWCDVPGKVYATKNASGNTVINFAPLKPLAKNKTYYVIIHGIDTSSSLPATCGNGKIDPGEECDDGNHRNGDGCSSSCLLEGTQPVTSGGLCGNGKIDPGEACDDGNAVNGDGCSDHCLREGKASEAATGFNCGNGVVERTITGGGEDCDGGTGCTSNCLESGASMSGIESIHKIAMAGNYIWHFTTGPEICDVDYLRVNVLTGNAPYATPKVYYDVDQDLFNCAGKNSCPRDIDSSQTGNQHLLEVYPIDDETGDVLNPFNYNWSWLKVDPDNIINIPASLSTNTAEITANPKNGSAYLKISAIGKTIYDGKATKNFHILNFLCQDPWPSLSDWPWKDNISVNPNASCDIAGSGCLNTNFSFYYCRDAGKTGESDDLPALDANPLVIGKKGNTLKEFFFIENNSGTKGPIIINDSFTPCQGPKNTIYKVTAEIISTPGLNITTAPPQAEIKNTSGAVVATINLSKVVGTPDIYTGSWKDTICGSSSCSYYMDITATDLKGNSTTEEDIPCS